MGLPDVADWHNLAAAFHRAAKGARNGAAAQRFRAHLEERLGTLRAEILDGTVEVGEMSSFRIRDPKPRLIYAPDFRERVLHHAVMAHVGPVLDRALVDDTYACRRGRGTLAAVRRCRQHLQRFPWFVQIDIRGYFASIDHAILLRQLGRKFKTPGLLSLLDRIVDAFHTVPGKGLPIGALTSQHFANFYLSGLDRRLLEDKTVRGLVRYMDDLVWWLDDRETARATLSLAGTFAQETLALTIKDPPRIGRSRDGLLFCGYRILPGAVLLSRRRKRRYAERRRYWEQACAAGRIDERTLQSGFAAVLGMTRHANAASWRREQLQRHPQSIPI
ncbi:MAG: reverse transcriptase domain-containing protein, partial [Pseudomonadota bacterium]